jgi:hypothetical protein
MNYMEEINKNYINVSSFKVYEKKINKLLKFITKISIINLFKLNNSHYDYIYIYSIISK